MRVNVTDTLRKALSELEAERAHLDRQLLALRQALGSARAIPSNSHRRSRMSAAARRAIRRRTKASSEKRRAADAKKSAGKGHGSKPRAKAKARGK